MAFWGRASLLYTTQIPTLMMTFEVAPDAILTTLKPLSDVQLQLSTSNTQMLLKTMYHTAPSPGGLSQLRLDFHWFLIRKQ